VVAVILSGGLGTRLKPFTMTIPKPLLPLGEIPILEVVVRQLAAAGFTRIVLTLGYMAPVFAAFFGDGSKWGIRIDYCREEHPLGTAGSLLLADSVGDPLPSEFLVMNGDVLTDLRFAEMVRVHRERAAAATIALSEREVRIDYGVIESSPDGAFQDYREKPTIEYEVSMGVNVLSRECLALIPPDRRFDMPELVLALHRQGSLVHCFRSRCYWQDIGRFDDYQRASDDFVREPERFLPKPGT
jgi:NDP-sugar pyrophosphorylase family protein